ncbi:hypothetical protein JXB27_02675 [Candidatus Woesearchaeota archaeon]|nr:hypothetical protein [Candidatus Woesearchaeota archaeon]
MKKTLILLFLVLIQGVYAVSVEDVVEKYRESKTISIYDSCVESSNEVWTLLNNSGINAKLCVGNVNEDISSLSSRSFFNKLNHAWLIADEIAIETTGGFLVEREMNSNYYQGLCFDDLNKFNEFTATHDKYYDVCNEALNLQKKFGYSAKTVKKINECDALFEKLEELT